MENYIPITVPDRHISVTPSDVTEYTPPLRRVICSSAGVISLEDRFGNVVGFPALAGIPIDGYFARVRSTGTTVAGTVVGQY